MDVTQHVLAVGAMLFSSLNIQIAPCPLANLCSLQTHNTINEAPIKCRLRRRNVYRITICRFLTANSSQAPTPTRSTARNFILSVHKREARHPFQEDTAPAWCSMQHPTARHDSMQATDLLSLTSHGASPSSRGLCFGPSEMSFLAFAARYPRYNV
ncbi:hypothetical protein AOQ84DRAFT_218491 [Glonium stellatum]|uniref:Uncharacterized protein n=1 Tax=Glonium stellatum TaxID=574774 RepID=A0A8E2FCR4_9PEZI|nr:hypothetical protein AOQ84DRAFT_218491 [Glonium stellatum]